MDHLTQERRSWLMSRVGAKDTSPEIRVRKRAHAMGLRYRLHRSDIPGTPDLVFPKYRVIIFVHGCFWHRHPGCKKATLPKSQVRFWQNKFDSNVARDRRAIDDLNALGWRVSIIWECETKNTQALSLQLRGIFKF